MKKGNDCLFLCQFFYPEYISSATLPFDTALALQEAGYSVGVLCGYPKEYNIWKKVPKKEIYQGIKIHRLKYLQMKRTSRIGRGVNYLSFILSVILHLPDMCRYRLIFVYSNPPILPLIAVWAKWIFHIQLIFISYDVYPEIGIKSGKIKQGGLIDKCFRDLNRRIFKNADKIVAVSQDMKAYLERERKLSNDKVKVIPNWYEKEKLKKREDIKNPLFKSIPKEAFIVSYFGNLGICQEVETFLDAIRLMKNDKTVHFIFAGHGNKIPFLKETIISEKLSQVHIFDFLQGTDYLDALSMSDACVVTLIKGLYGLCSPSKVYGYMMAGKPILAVLDKKMELAKMVESEKFGYLISHQDSTYMKQCIYELKNSPELCEKMGENSRLTYEKEYEKTICLNKYIDVVQERINNHV